MSSSARHRQPALWRHLLGWTLGVLVVIWITLVALAWSTGLREAKKFADGQMVAVSRLWMAASPDQVAVAAAPLPPDREHEYVQDVAVLVWQAGKLVSDTHGMAQGLDLGRLEAPGFTDLTHRAGGRSTAWRAYSASAAEPEGERRVVVLMDIEHRNELGIDLAEHIALPALLVLPLVALLLWWAIRRGLRPLDKLSLEMAELDGMAGQRLDEGHRFREFSSTVLAINQLVDGLQAQAMREREFASDVAHELRTPLASIALQAGAARHALSAPEASQATDLVAYRQALQGLEQESLRAGRILSQLLDLARAQRPGAEAPDTSESRSRKSHLGELAARVLGAHAQEGHDSGHELSLVQADDPVWVPGSPMLLELALRNLVVNALHHTPAGTQVVVSVWRSAGAVGVSVSDDGQRTGVPPDGAAPLPSPDGLGLGLRLVQRIAERCGAELRRDHGQAPMTTRFTLSWASVEPGSASP